MKTAKQYAEEKARAKQKWRDDYRAGVLAKLEKIIAASEGKPAYQPIERANAPGTKWHGRLVDHTDYNEVRENLRKHIAESPMDGSGWSDLACDECRTEMWRDSDMLMSNPPQSKVTCPGCGYITYVPYV